MRRKDLEIADFNSIIEVVDRCNCLRLGISGEDFPRVIPVCFGYEVSDDKLILYFHGSNQGEKAALLDKSPHIFIEGDICSGYREREDKGIACIYESFMAHGTAVRIFDKDAERALGLIMTHCGFSPRPFPDGLLNFASVYKLYAEDLTGKRSV